MTLRFGVIPTNGRASVLDAVDSLLPQVHGIAVVEAGHEVTHHEYPAGVTVLRDQGPDLNISRWWNLGIDWAAEQAKLQGDPNWDVVVMNDDVILPMTWVCYVADDMRALDCAAACSGGSGNQISIQRSPGPVNVFMRLQGYAFVIAGESGIRAEETMRWYFSDDWVDWVARSKGGMVMFPGCEVTHRTPNGQMTGELHQAVAEDAAKFKEHWGMMPW